MKYDVIVIGAGLSGLSAASLLAKRGLRGELLSKVLPQVVVVVFLKERMLFLTRVQQCFTALENMALMLIDFCLTVWKSPFIW